MERLTKFVAGADALITDATYTNEEYQSKIGWGHSCVSQVVNLAHEAEVKNSLYLVHHDPDQDDNAIDAKHAAAKAQLAELNSSTQLMTPKETYPENFS